MGCFAGPRAQKKTGHVHFSFKHSFLYVFSGGADLIEPGLGIELVLIASVSETVEGFFSTRE